MDELSEEFAHFAMEQRSKEILELTVVVERRMDELNRQLQLSRERNQALRQGIVNLATRNRLLIAEITRLNKLKGVNRIMRKMMEPTTFKTWATLKPNTPFNNLFPDARIPIRSPIPIIPREEGSPPCYTIDANFLSQQQIEGLAELLLRQWQPECKSKEQAIDYIREGLPLQCEWFIGVTSTDFELMLSIAEAGEELERLREICSEPAEWDEMDW